MKIGREGNGRGKRGREEEKIKEYNIIYSI